MNKWVVILGIIILYYSCSNNKADQTAADITDSAETTDSIFAWQADLDDSSGRLIMKRSEEGPQFLTVASVLQFLNDNNENVKLEFLRTSNDTVYLKIPQAAYLTQQMGSTGATMKLATIIYDLTEIPGIRYVNLDFEEGDHAQPGTFSRDYFNGQ